MMLLSKNINLNNVISSSMLENLKLIGEMRHYTPFHQFVQLNYSNIEHLQKFISKILTLKPETQQGDNSSSLPLSHLHDLEEERQESYLMEDNAEQPVVRQLDELALSQM